MEDKMIKHTLYAPQLGEGLTTVKVIALYKNVGEFISKDEALYGVETDKATVDIESPYAGEVSSWLVEPGTVIAVGNPVAEISVVTQKVVGEGEKESQLSSRATVDYKENPTDIMPRHTVEGVFIPPRVRAYCKQQGIPAEEVVKIPAMGEGLDFESVNCYLKNTRKTEENKKEETLYKSETLSEQQRWLNAQFKRSHGQVIPATLVSRFDLAHFKRVNERLLREVNLSGKNVSQYISEFQFLSYWVSQVLRDFPHLRSRLDINENRQIYPNVNLGIAVQTKEGELVTAAIEKADDYEFPSFISLMNEKIQQATEGDDQASESLSVILSYTGGRSVLFGTPSLVSPSAATLFFAIPDDERGKPNGCAYLSLTFDHRLINGIEAAAFLDAIADNFRRDQHKVLIEEVNVNVKNDDSEALLEPKNFTDLVINKLADLLAIPATQVDKYESLGMLGLDSIKALSLKDYLEQLLKTTLPATLLWHCPNVASLVEHCLSKKEATEPEATEPETKGIQSADPIDMELLISELEALSDAERHQLLDDII